MVRSENLESKISALRKYLKLLDRYRAMDIEAIKADQDLSGAVERYLYLAAQAAIDLAEMFMKFRRLGKADSMGESFLILEREGILSPVLSGKLVQMVGFRNVLSHGYEHLNYDIVGSVLKDGVKDLADFAAAIERAIQG